MQMLLELDNTIQPVPTFDEVISDLDDLPSLLHECIEAGTIRGQKVAGEERFGDDPLDPWLVATVLRGRVRRMLKKRGVHSTDDLSGLNISSQPLIGLLFHFKDYSFRILKAVDDKAPGCGQSRPRKRFYDQVPTKYRSNEGKAQISKLNLLVLYATDKEGTSKLFLACTSRGARFPHEVAYHWIESLVHPVDQPMVPPPTSAPTTQDPLADIVQKKSAPNKDKKQA